jgi:hypothetical protein
MGEIGIENLSKINSLFFLDREGKVYLKYI